MEWSELYGRVHQPAYENFCEYVKSDLWLELNSFLQETYHILPQIEYSGCSIQKGWNIKYRKGGKSLCTLYPMQGYFIVLAVIGEREINEAELLIPLCSEYTQNLFKQTISGYSGKWMMIDVKKPNVLHDVKKIIELRVSRKS